MKFTEEDGKLVSLTLNGNTTNFVEGTNHAWGECVYPQGFSQRTERHFENEVLSERYIFTNTTDSAITLERGTLGVWATFNDNYEGAEICKKSKCHAHIWLGGRSSYVNALAMSGQPMHLGLMLTEGSLCTYSVEREENSNDRGDILLLATPTTVGAGESYVIAWDLFAHSGYDFTDKLKKYPNYLNIEADHFTFFENESPSISVNGSKLKLNTESGYYTVTENGSFFRYQIKPELYELAKRRCRFIMENQQENEDETLLGAYLIYDNETHSRYFEEMPNPNHNAGRERIGMGALMAKYLQSHYDASLHESLKKYTNFVLKNYYDEENGVVYNCIGHQQTPRRRIYNNAWYASFFLELYLLEKDTRWLKCMYGAFCDLYNNGGIKFYPLGIEMTASIRALEEAGMLDEKAVLMSYFTQNAGFILETDTNYPNFEVNFEDNIVVPAGSVLLQMYELTGEIRYLTAAERHINMHGIFVGYQPDARMHGASVHHWDDFWFGKRRLFGDTYPHYWSSTGAMLYARYGKTANKAEYVQKARACLRTCLSCIFDDGSATCAIFTPFASNGIQGEFIDPWANDQDWAMYNALIFDSEFNL